MRSRLWWAGLLVVVAVVYLAYTGWQGATLYYLTPAEARDRALSGRTFRVAGNVGPDVAWDGTSLELRFKVVDDSAALPVVYRGAPPDNFGPGQQVVVEGTADGQGGLVANRLIMKCPSKYEQASVATRSSGGGVLYLGGIALALAVGLAVVASRRFTAGRGGRAGTSA